MTKVRIEPGICGFTAIAEAEAAEDFMVHLRVASGCAAVQEMMKALGSTFSAFDVCLTRPGTGPFYAYARGAFPRSRRLPRHRRDHQVRRSGMRSCSPAGRRDIF